MGSVAISGCASEAPDSASTGEGNCPACPAGQICDPQTDGCVEAWGEGEPCGLQPDGSVPVGRCGPGLTCGSVGSSVKRCSRDCTSSDAAQVCGEGRSCYSRGDGSDSGFCAAIAAEGEPCDSAALTYCAGKTVCITPSAQVTLGRCFASCVPGEGQCPAGQSCADPFPNDPGHGFCVVPAGRYPEKCDYASLLFCGEGEVCVRPLEDETWGYCHRRCSSNTDCSGASCVEPVDSMAFCARAVPRCVNDPENPEALCEHCDALDDLFCAAGDICVGTAGTTVCKQDCTGEPDACPPGTNCRLLSNSQSKACL